MRNSLAWFVLALAFVSEVHAQKIARPDPLFPDPGRPSVSVATGVPYVGIGEIAVGLQRSIAFGVIGGGTPIVGAFGVRPRFAIPMGSRARLVAQFPWFYYPRMREAREPWLLLRASFALEGRFTDRLRLNAGASVVYVDCVDMFFQRGAMSDDDGFDGGVWNAFQVGGSFGVSERADVFFDLATVHHGVELAGDDWVGGPPVVVILGVTATFDAPRAATLPEEVRTEGEEPPSRARRRPSVGPPGFEPGTTRL